MKLWEAPTGVMIPQWTERGLIDGVDVATRAAYDVDMAVLPIAIQMERTGIPLNVEALKEIEREKRPEWERLLAEMRSFVGTIPAHVIKDAGEFNPQSPAQLSWVLYSADGPCKLTAPKMTDTGAPSADKDALAKLADHTFVQTLLKWRVINHAFSNYVYGKKLIVREDGRVHPNWNTTGARTGRWSSSPNFQNWPRWLRRCIEAPPGYTIIGADYAQLELRIMAALCGDAGLIRRCRDADETRKLEPEWDPHSFVASHFFKAAFLELDLHDPRHTMVDCRCETCRRRALREVIKSVIYGMNYGAGARTVLEVIYMKGYDGMPLNLQIIQQAVDIIFELFPGIPAWRNDTLAWSLAHQQVRSSLLRRWRSFPWGDVEAPTAWNFPIQSTGADIINLRLPVLDERLRAFPTAQIMAQVHDALYVICRDADAVAVAPILSDSMSVELRLAPGAPLMPFTASAKAGKTWDQVS